MPTDIVGIEATVQLVPAALVLTASRFIGLISWDGSSSLDSY